MRLFRSSRARGAIAALAAAVVAAAIAVVGLNQGNDVRGARMLPGSAWLASARVGQITLLDGASAEVSAQVKVAGPGDALTVVQQGSTAYTVDQSAGTIRRVDGATFDPTPPAAPIADAHGGGLDVIAGPTSLYTLDTTRGLLASTDPKTLDRHGEMLSVASRLAAGTVTVDDAGALWAVDTGSGDVVRVLGTDKTTRSGVVKPGTSVITIAHGHPVIVDLTDRKAVSLDGDNGRVTGTFGLDLQPNDQIQVSASPHAERLYVVAARGVLDVCDITAERCDNAIPLNVGSDFGPAVEAGDRVFVPDYTTGQVWIISLRDSRVIAKPNVLQPKTRFQLMARDGLVFYNDTNSEAAGVVQLDGGVTQIKKYDKDNPDKGVNQPDAGGQASGQRNQPSQPSGQPTQPSGAQPPSGAGDSHHDNQPPVDPNVPGPNTPAHPADPQHPNDPPPLNLQIVVDKATPTVNEPISLTVSEASGTPSSAHWTYGDGDTNDGVTTNHKWTKARPEPYIVSVEVTMPDGRHATKSVNITVSEIPTYQLTVAKPSGGTVTGGGIDCPKTVCYVDLHKDDVVTLTATPDDAHQAGTWSGCQSSDNKCDVRMGTQPVNVSYTFPTKPEPPVRLTVTAPANGSISGGGISCPGNACFVDVAKGTYIKLSATPAQNYVFESWTGDCTGSTCSLTMNDKHSVSATFKPAPYTIDVSIDYDHANSAQGKITVDDGHTCQPTCHYTIERNSGKAQLTFTAVNMYSKLTAWGHDCAGVSPDVKTCTVTLDHNISVYAHFSGPH